MESKEQPSPIEPLSGTERSPRRAPRRRLWLLLVCGLLLLGVGVVVRMVATDAVTEWRAGRMPDEALAKAAAAENAPFPFVFEWAKRLESSGRLPEAERVYARAVQLAPTHMEAVLGFGRTAFTAGDWGKATSVLSRTVDQWPDNAEARFLFAMVLANTFRTQAARDQLKAGVKLNPNKAEAFQSLGDLEMKLKNADGAVEAYGRAKALAPQTKRIRSRYGEALVGAGRYAEALVELEAALQEDPSDVDARFNLGKALANSGKKEDRPRAMRELNRVVEFSTNKSRAYFEAARIWLREGDRGNGTQALERAFDLNPFNTEILGLLAETYEKEGRRAEAQRVRKALDHAQTLATEREQLLARLEAGEEMAANLVRLGRVDMKSMNVGEARAAFGVAVFLDPGNAEATRGLEEAKAKLGR